MRDGRFSFCEPVLEMRGADWEREAGGFPWGGLCLKFNMLFLSLNAPAMASSSFVIVAPLSVWWMRSLICPVLPLFPEWPMAIPTLSTPPPNPSHL